MLIPGAQLMLKPIHPVRKSLEVRSYYGLIHKGGTQWFHWENLSFPYSLMDLLLKGLDISDRGLKNALDLQLVRHTAYLTGLPDSFDDYQILLLTDLHLDGNPGLSERIFQIADEISYDIAILGGDYHFRFTGNPNLAINLTNTLAAYLMKKAPVAAILGNHDEYIFAQNLDACGVEMLVNSHYPVTRKGESIYIVGVDDCHYYGTHDFSEAEAGIPVGACKILVCHSPEKFKQAAKRGYALYLAGHTHGGQICLPGKIPLLKNARVPWKFATGAWRYRQMAGYTSLGTGSSGVQARFNCPPEMVLLTLKKNRRE
jgi:predicted MPP superfamily phosphohydrolase